ncbi:hypothetical protein MtrunA17_Chr5g0430971 [Medicago truncatula]|uniref:Uncharacterized protein n=1 Tax=Medicago truncatula TaxID=3880 RepID=G7K763_MEDTR|nr:hypothetical protein MTR_5g072270 [Medicago truncatula]RHN56577.1 hypothetical protein MtrunA17_Chr5g0430971 [Medicago truncatula]
MPLSVSDVTCPPSGGVTFSTASAWFIPEPHQTGEVYFDTTCNIPDCFQDCRLTPQTNRSLFSVFCPRSHAFRKAFKKVIHPKIVPSQARLTVEFLLFRLKQFISCIYR